MCHSHYLGWEIREFRYEEICLNAGIPALQQISRGDLNSLTTDDAGRFHSGLSWFCPFQSPLVVHTQQNNENTHINFNFWSSAAPKMRLATCEISRTQHSGTSGYGRNLLNLRNSSVTARQISLFPNQALNPPLLVVFSSRSLGRRELKSLANSFLSGCWCELMSLIGPVEEIRLKARFCLSRYARRAFDAH